MRGAGKTYISKLAAEALDWELVDADVVFAEKYGHLKTYVEEKGWDAFRQAETQVLRDMIAEKGRNCIISLGGGIVESLEAREILKKYAKAQGPVVYIIREVDEVVAYLEQDKSRPAYGEAVIDVFRRREPWYEECSSHTFINYTPIALKDTWQAVPWSPAPTSYRVTQIFFGQITGVTPNICPKVNTDRRSYFLSLTYPDVTPALPMIEELGYGSDAIELRVDLLSQHGPPTSPNVPPLLYVASQVAALRRNTALPIIFTVRTVSQGGMFPDNAEDAALALMMLGIRTGCEYIDVEISWSPKLQRALKAAQGFSQIIASWHDWSGNMCWDGAGVREKYAIAAELGDIVKIVGKANTVTDNFALQQFAQSMSAKPLIAINMGQAGQMSRILNTILTPVTHPLLPTKAAPGQLSVAEIQRGLHLLGLLPAKQFYLFGSPIAQSMSPTIHNTGFQTLGLPYTYGLYESSTINDHIKSILKSADFGGASVTIPLKLDIMELLDEVSPAAKLIGAVNTVLVRQAENGSRTLYGDNTDWMGIAACIQNDQGEDLPRNSKGLVIGSGGTSRAAIFALYSLGVSTIYLYNRTRSTAVALAKHFPQDYNIIVLDAVDNFPNGAPTAIVSTIPATAASSEASEGKIHLTSALLGAQGGVVVDMAYRPSPTPLLQLVRSINDVNWRSVEGIGVLLEQGYRQFEAWTGMNAPQGNIRRAVREKYQ